MFKNAIATNQAGSPAISNADALSQALANVGGEEAGGGDLGGHQLLKLAKQDGSWSYGQEATELGDELVAVDPSSFEHGFICWVAGDRVGEVSVSITEPQPDVDKLPSHDNPWNAQLLFRAQSIEGGVPLVYKTSAAGGKEAIRKLAQVIALRIQTGSSQVVPLVRATNTSYTHKQFGKIFKPVFGVVEWVGADGEPEDLPDRLKEEAAAEPAQGRVRTRRRSS